MMRLIRISKANPDPADVHILGGGRVARKVRRPKYKSAVHKAKLPKKPPDLFGDSAQAYRLNMEALRVKNTKKRDRAAEMRAKAFGQDNK